MVSLSVIMWTLNHNVKHIEPFITSPGDINLRMISLLALVSVTLVIFDLSTCMMFSTYKHAYIYLNILQNSDLAQFWILN